MDKVDPTPVRKPEVWDEEALRVLDAYVETEPFLVRISAAKRLRDLVEREARAADEARITAARVQDALAAMAGGRA
jgi:chlorophyllide a reductase subunit Z